MGGGGIRAPGENVFGAVPPAPEPPLDSPRPDDFSECYAAHFHSLTVQLFAHTGDLSEAQDVVQEAFCRALARWSRLVSYDDPIAWVRRGAWDLPTSPRPPGRNAPPVARRPRHEGRT